jgi:hypothetical protein
MAKKPSRPLTHTEKSKIDEELAKQGLSPWLPISPDQLPERLRKKSQQIPVGKAKPKRKKKRGS